MKPKYKLTINDIQKPGNIEKLQRDGFSREMISKTMYRETAGATQQQRNDMMSKLFDRGR